MPLLPMIRYISVIVVICTTVVLVVHYLLTKYLINPWWQLLIGGLANIVLLGGLLYFIERHGVMKDLRWLLWGRVA
jgi:hypothetical protein